LDIEINTLRKSYKHFEKELSDINVDKNAISQPDFSFNSLENYRKDIAVSIDNLENKEKQVLLLLILSHINVNFVKGKGHEIEIVWAIPISKMNNIQGIKRTAVKLRSTRERHNRRVTKRPYEILNMRFLEFLSLG